MDHYTFAIVANIFTFLGVICWSRFAYYKLRFCLWGEEYNEKTGKWKYVNFWDWLILVAEVLFALFCFISLILPYPVTVVANH